MFGNKSAGFDRSLEKATSQLLLEPDWDAILQICDSIRQADVTAKYAVTGIRKKIQSDNPHVSMFALQVLESSMKNCGSLVHAEVATKDFMEFMKDQAKTRNDPVKAKILEMVQVWSHAFRNEPSYKVVQDTFHLMKMEGYKFPTLKEADAMFAAEKAPEWKDSDVCTRCRVAFGMVQRKHHCRNCGEVFCSKCSSKNSIIPRFGIEREVRVCDACFDKINKPTKAGADDLPAEYLSSPLSKQPQNPPTKTEQELQEEEELQLALALSKSEHETKEKERERLRHNYSLYAGDERSASPQSGKNSQMSQPAAAVTAIDTSDMDPELARYLNRNYWQQKSEHQAVTSTTTPSAPAVAAEPKTSTVKTQEQVQTLPYQNGDTEEDQTQFLNALNSSIEIFVNRMSSNSQRGRSIANDSSVQSLFAVISNMHPQLMKYIQEQEDLRSHYESLQDKLAQLRDAREALDALREEHREKRRREMEELERQRQIQMAQKLEIMRQKKHEYLEMQRQLALQRLQEQEREMQMRFEQQKHLTQMRQMQTYGYPQAMPQMYGQMPQGVPGQMPPQGMPPQGPPHLQQQGFSPGGSAEGSPVHQTGAYNPQAQGMMPPGAAPPNQGMYMPPNSQQPFTQSGQPNMGYAPPQASMAGGGANLPAGGAVPGGYQPHLPSQTQTDGGQMSGPPQGGFPPGGVGYPDQGPASMPPQMPPGGPQPPSGPGYSSMQPNMEYNSFNMQSMSGALPQQNQTAYTNPQQQYMGAPPPPQGQFQGGAPPQQMPPQNQPPPHQENEASLICFD